MAPRFQWRFEHLERLIDVFLLFLWRYFMCYFNVFAFFSLFVVIERSIYITYVHIMDQSDSHMFQTWIQCVKYVHRVYHVGIQYVSNMYTIYIKSVHYTYQSSTRYVSNMYTIRVQHVQCMYQFCMQPVSNMYRIWIKSAKYM